MQHTGVDVPSGLTPFTRRGKSCYHILTMPSWNIHTAHAELLLRTEGPSALGIRNVDAFLLGNLLPDVYVGYMVPDISHKLEYRETHYADPGFVPEPRYWDFFESYGQRNRDGQVDDLILGTWAHLLADHDYNLQNNRFIDARGIKPGEQTRIRKQGDFDLFGRTLDISLAPNITPEVLVQCAAFSQYELYEEDMVKASEAMRAIVADNAARHVSGTPDYQMLDEQFFSSTFKLVDAHIREGLLAYVAGDANWGGKH